ncbi:endonuclease/exonuclease/phosphatase family protein [Mangrovimonas cancribranchiae]|uniref:Endonuclease n=1 Tax=Mangrovimonas cancribranchiae TaxID=3080055 RepID=A0AAU6P7A0_9FLAO
MPKKQFTVAFYNLENLFDIYDDNLTNDNDFLPNSVKRWTSKRYYNKIRKLSYAIKNIGLEETNFPPALLGFAEVENKLVLQDLINSSELKHHKYDFVHYNSPDERGIDVALLYNKTIFTVTRSEPFSVDIYNEDGTKDYTRDILLVTGKLDGSVVHIIVNHWPSRHGGEDVTEQKRLTASNEVDNIINLIKQEHESPKIIVMGDFNDDPYNKSMTQLTEKQDLFNPMRTLQSHDKGTTVHYTDWNLFDQILFSTNFFEKRKGELTYKESDIFNERFLQVFKGKYEAAPFRTYIGKKYQGGYSDHFPVYILLESY